MTQNSGYPTTDWQVFRRPREGIAGRSRLRPGGVEVHLWTEGEIGVRFELVFDASSHLTGFGLHADHRCHSDDGVALKTDAQPPAGWVPAPITTRSVRRARVAELEAIARSSIVRTAAFLGRLSQWVQQPEAVEVTESAYEVLTATPRPGRRGHGDLVYAQLAADYVNLLSDGGDAAKRPNVHLAARLNYSTKRITNMLSEARRRGMLTRPAVAGRAGGELTERARRLLTEGKI